MASLRAPLAVLGVVLLAVGGVQLLDPVLDERPAPEVDFSEPPAEVAADSAARFEHVDYAYRIDVADNRSGPWEQVRVARIEHSDREYYKSGPLGSRGVVIYGTDAAAFVRPGSDGVWRFAAHPDVVYPVRTLSQPFLVDKIGTSGASMIADNRSMLVVRLDSNPLKIAERFPGNATIYVSKTNGTVVKTVVSYDSGRSRISYFRFRLIGTEPAVERPDDLGTSSLEIGWDLLRGPLFRPFHEATP